MRKALTLAKRGIGRVEPNPAVGCIIVKNGRIIGKGRHKRFGGPHAEINALADCTKKGTDPCGSTIYVTLEPCCHHGKTPPCTDALKTAKPAEIFVATIDPSPYVNAQGIHQLRAAGIKVHTGICEQQARLLNAPFIKFSSTGRCWVIVKWAQSIDGKLAWADRQHRWISNEQSRKDAQILRRRAQAVIVGIKTVIADDPLLTRRPNTGSQPVRIVLDPDLRTPGDCKLIKTTIQGPVMLVISADALRCKNKKADFIRKKGAEILALPLKNKLCDLEKLLDILGSRAITQVLVEGGPTVISSFLEQQLVDEVRIYFSPQILGLHGTADIAKAAATLPTEFNIQYPNIKTFGDNFGITGYSKKALKATLNASSSA